MRFEALKQRVERTEELVEGRGVQTINRYAALKSEWREAWTPLRIVVVGLASGFIAGHAQPGKAVSRLGKLSAKGSSSLGMIRTIMGLMASVQATIAAFTAKDAAESADNAAGSADHAADKADEASAGAPASSPSPGTPDAAQPRARESGAEPAAVPPVDRRRPDPTWDSPPPPAEAATDVSER